MYNSAMSPVPFIALCMFILAAAMGCMPAPALAEDEYISTRSGNVEVVHDQLIADGALEALRLYRKSVLEINEMLGIGNAPESQTTIVLVKSKEGFVRLSGSEQISAYAVGARGLIVLDYHRVLTRPFTLAGTLKHEAAHLAIHNHVRGPIPRWLNEGIAQWVSGAEAEIELSPMGRALDKAALTGHIIPMRKLEGDFPSDRAGMQLAYEQSASMVSYISNKYGDESMGRILDWLRMGMDIDSAIRSTTGQGYDEVERAWADWVRSRVNWMNYILGNFMEVLLILAALLSVIGYAIIHYRIRNYKDDDDEEQMIPYDDEEDDKDKVE